MGEFKERRKGVKESFWRDIADILGKRSLVAGQY